MKDFRSVFGEFVLRSQEVVVVATLPDSVDVIVLGIKEHIFNLTALTESKKLVLQAPRIRIPCSAQIRHQDLLCYQRGHAHLDVDSLSEGVTGCFHDRF
jgi:hypothetical protein